MRWSWSWSGFGSGTNVSDVRIIPVIAHPIPVQIAGNMEPETKSDAEIGIRVKSDVPSTLKPDRLGCDRLCFHHANFIVNYSDGIVVDQYCIFELHDIGGCAAEYGIHIHAEDRHIRLSAYVRLIHEGSLSLYILCRSGICPMRAADFHTVLKPISVIISPDDRRVHLQTILLEREPDLVPIDIDLRRSQGVPVPKIPFLVSSKHLCVVFAHLKDDRRYHVWLTVDCHVFLPKPPDREVFADLRVHIA